MRLTSSFCDKNMDPLVFCFVLNCVFFYSLAMSVETRTLHISMEGEYLLLRSTDYVFQVWFILLNSISLENFSRYASMYMY